MVELAQTKDKDGWRGVRSEIVKYELHVSIDMLSIDMLSIYMLSCI